MFFSLLTILALLMGAFNKSNGDNELCEGSLTLFDFTKGDSTDDWIEQSDTVREVGMSKATFPMERTKLFTRAIFFTLLNPQENGAGFAGMRILKSFNLADYDNISLKLRGQGENKNYKIVLRHEGKNNEPDPTYEQFFTVPYEKFGVVSLPLKDFQPYFRGKKVDAKPLNTAKITSIGIQIFGGVYLDIKQRGVSALEIDWIKACKNY